MAHPRSLTSERAARRRLKRLLRKWQRRLGLRDERLAVAFADAATDESLRERGAYAQVAFENASHMIRLNRLRRPRYWELDIVHELLHVLFASVEEGFEACQEPAKTLLAVLLHRGIQRLARTLARAGRQPWAEEATGTRAAWERKR